MRKIEEVLRLSAQGKSVRVDLLTKWDTSLCLAMRPVS